MSNFSAIKLARQPGYCLMKLSIGFTPPFTPPFGVVFLLVQKNWYLSLYEYDKLFFYLKIWFQEILKWINWMYRERYSQPAPTHLELFAFALITFSAEIWIDFVLSFYSRNFAVQRRFPGASSLWLARFWFVLRREQACCAPGHFDNFCVFQERLPDIMQKSVPGWRATVCFLSALKFYMLLNCKKSAMPV